MSKILIGWAEESLVPDKKVSLAGQFYERISETVESEIFATAMAVESDGEQMILVSVDMEGFPEALVNLAREKFAKLKDVIDPRKLIISATHTHAAMRVAGRGSAKLKSGQMVDARAAMLEEFLPKDKLYVANVTSDDSILTPEEGTELVTDKIALAAQRAWKNRKEAYYTNEFGRAAVGMCRRVCYDDGSAQMWGDTNSANFVSMEGGNDSGIELIYTFDTDKKLTGIVANIACPAQILEQRNFISADYWGRTKAILREKLGEHIYLLGLCGAAGDQCPRDLVRWVNPETPINDPNVKREHVIKRKADPSMYDISGCNRVGKRIANEIISIYEEITDLKEEAVFEHKIIDLDLPLRRVTIRDYDNAVREIAYYIEKNKNKEAFNYEDSARLNVHIGTIQRYRDQQFKNVVTAETHIIRFGDISISTNPFELFLDYGNIIKARSLSEQTFIIQLCCGGLGYLPTEKAEKGGHYSAYVSSGSVGHEGGDLLVRKTVEEINKMF
jgi:hypothetical protein